jgi:hypothetical protein
MLRLGTDGNTVRISILSVIRNRELDDKDKTKRDVLEELLGLLLHILRNRAVLLGLDRIQIEELGRRLLVA